MALITGIHNVSDLGKEGDVATTMYLSLETKVDPANELFFGRAVIRGSADGEVEHPSGTAGTFMGVVRRDEDIDPADLTTGDLPAGHDAQIVTRGVMWVIAEDAVTEGAAVYYRHNAPGALPEALGRFRSDVDAGDATLIPGARWASSATAGNPAKLELNIP